ncbi:hypothetical protein DFS34DRAFT_398807 [Phlyctochytrium arcticum]|nr:hypothetical protein DFS34DRAFT_398807 [Phlyctochytrium arcticum]
MLGLGHIDAHASSSPTRTRGGQHQTHQLASSPLASDAPPMLDRRSTPLKRTGMMETPKKRIQSSVRKSRVLTVDGTVEETLEAPDTPARNTRSKRCIKTIDIHDFLLTDQPSGRKTTGKKAPASTRKDWRDPNDTFVIQDVDRPKVDMEAVSPSPLPRITTTTDDSEMANNTPVLQTRPPEASIANEDTPGTNLSRVMGGMALHSVQRNNDRSRTPASAPHLRTNDLMLGTPHSAKPPRFRAPTPRTELAATFDQISLHSAQKPRAYLFSRDGVPNTPNRYRTPMLDASSPFNDDAPAPSSAVRSPVQSATCRKLFPRQEGSGTPRRHLNTPGRATPDPSAFQGSAGPRSTRRQLFPNDLPPRHPKTLFGSSQKNASRPVPASSDNPFLVDADSGAEQRTLPKNDTFTASTPQRGSQADPCTPPDKILDPSMTPTPSAPKANSWMREAQTPTRSIKSAHAASAVRETPSPTLSIKSARATSAMRERTKRFCSIPEAEEISLGEEPQSPTRLIKSAQKPWKTSRVLPSTSDNPFLCNDASSSPSPLFSASMGLSQSLPTSFMSRQSDSQYIPPLSPAAPRSARKRRRAIETESIEEEDESAVPPMIPAAQDDIVDMDDPKRMGRHDMRRYGELPSHLDFEIPDSDDEELLLPAAGNHDMQVFMVTNIAVRHPFPLPLPSSENWDKENDGATITHKIMMDAERIILGELPMTLFSEYKTIRQPTKFGGPPKYFGPNSAWSSKESSRCSTPHARKGSAPSLGSTPVRRRRESTSSTPLGFGSSSPVRRRKESTSTPLGFGSSSPVRRRKDSTSTPLGFGSSSPRFPSSLATEVSQTSPAPALVNTTESPVAALKAKCKTPLAQGVSAKSSPRLQSRHPKHPRSPTIDSAEGSAMTRSPMGKKPRAKSPSPVKAPRTNSLLASWRPE